MGLARMRHIEHVMGRNPRDAIEFRKFRNEVLNEMSSDRSKNTDLLEDQAESLAKHMAKLWLYHDYDDRHHANHTWLNQSSKFIKKLDRKGLPKVEDIRDILWEEVGGSIWYIPDKAKKETDNVPDVIINEKIVSDFRRFLKRFVNGYAEVQSANSRAGKSMTIEDIKGDS